MVSAPSLTQSWLRELLRVQLRVPHMEGVMRMACPFFMPTERFEGGAWLHPSRLPLGAGWHGHCTAAPPDSPPLSDEHVQHYCNLGYATTCSSLPSARTSDAVRFSVARHSAHRVTLRYACELNHCPGEHGTLEFVQAESRWSSPHPDPRIQRMAECYLESHLRRFESINPAPVLADALASEPS
jgi:hypothetical protein